MAQPADAAADLAELRTLLVAAKRQKVKELLQREIATLEQGDSPEAPPAPATEGNTSEPGASAAPSPSPIPIAIPSAAPVLLQAGKAPVQKSYSTVSSFSWDQDTDKVKIYFFLDGATKEGVELDVKPQSVDIRMHDVGAPGKHLRFGVPHLHKAVDPSSSRVIVKPSRVTVILPKKERVHWPDLHHKEDKLKPKLGEPKDPMAGIMDLMKNMYDEGDDEMKRTIAKAWSEGRTGNQSDPLMPRF